MRIRIILASLLFPLLSFSQGYKISIKVENTTDTVAYLGYHFGNQKYIQDTSRVENGEVLFEGDQPLDKGVYFYYSTKAFFEFIVDDQEFNIYTSAPLFIQSASVEGSEINKDFMALQKYNLEKQDIARNMQDSIALLGEGNEKQKLIQQLEQLNAEAINYQEAVEDKHKENFLGKFLNALQKPIVPDSIGANSNDKEFARFTFFKNHFFDNFDLSDEELLRSPVYHSVILEYLDKLTMQYPDSLIIASDEILGRAQSNEATFRYCLVTLSNKFETANIMGFDKVFVYLVENYYLNGKASWADDDLIERLKNRVNQIRPNLIGNRAPSLSLLDTLMNPLDLEHIEARFIVLYFYDHDCGHCKKKTPILLSQYPGLKEKDVEVMAVDINTDVEKWKDYVSSNNLTFLNGADPYVQSNFRYEYDIHTTPTVYILDENKTIVGKRIEVDNIPGFIDYLLRGY